MKRAVQTLTCDDDLYPFDSQFSDSTTENVRIIFKTNTFLILLLTKPFTLGNEKLICLCVIQAQEGAYMNHLFVTRRRRAKHYYTLFLSIIYLMNESINTTSKTDTFISNQLVNQLINRYIYHLIQFTLVNIPRIYHFA